MKRDPPDVLFSLWSIHSCEFAFTLMLDRMGISLLMTLLVWNLTHSLISERNEIHSSELFVCHFSWKPEWQSFWKLKTMQYLIKRLKVEKHNHPHSTNAQCMLQIKRELVLSLVKFFILYLSLFPIPTRKFL